MMMGNYNRVWFNQQDEAWPDPGAKVISGTIFVIFMLVVNILMLNVLIAVVSDSYDYARIRSQKIFLRSRLERTAEFDLMGLTTNRWSSLQRCFRWLESLFTTHNYQFEEDDEEVSEEKW